MPSASPDTTTIDRLVRRSLAVIRAGQSASGAYVAAPTFATYHYSWFRDGAFIADAMSRVGDIASAERFFGWCAGILVDRRSQVQRLIERARTGEPIPAGEFLHARYHLDGSESSAEWENLQLDGYGTWLWALDAHATRHGRPVEPYLEGAALSAAYIAAFHDRPCYDWWEEHPDGRHPSTLAALYAGLIAVVGWPGLGGELRQDAHQAAQAIESAVCGDAIQFGHVPKWLGSDAVDGSLIAVATPFGLLAPDEPLMQATVARIEADLVHGGGVHRYTQDVFYGGGEWPLLAAFLGWHYLRTGRRDEAIEQLTWIMAQANPVGDLPEQVAGHLLAPHEQARWIDRWGPSASPLLWSHAMFLTLATELGLVAPDVAAATAR